MAERRDQIEVGDGGWMGRWGEERPGVPCFDFDPLLDRGDLLLPRGDAGGCWHQVGNDRLVATAHAGGWTCLYLTDRGFLRVSDDGPPDSFGRLGGTFRVFHDDGREAASTVTVPPAARWGMGHAEWVHRSGEIEIRRRVRAPFGDRPYLVVEVEIGGPSPPAAYEERWALCLHPIVLGGLMSRWVPPPAGHTLGEQLSWHVMLAASTAMRAATERLRRGYRHMLRIESRVDQDRRFLSILPRYRGPLRRRDPGAPAWWDIAPKPLFLAALDGRVTEYSTDGGRAMRLRVDLRDGDPRLRFVIGSGAPGDVPGLLDEIAESDPRDDVTRWQRLFRVDVPNVPWLSREALWHASYLRGAQVRDDYFEGRIVPQGSAYGYIHGAQGAPRDYALALVPLTLFDPRGARDTLRLLMRMTRPDGMTYYAHMGHGMCSSAAGVHDAPSDLPLFFLWALTEHLWLTGDADFLDEEVPFYPKADGRRSTVRERACLAWRYLRDRIGTGEHGLLRVGSGDWSDPISLMVTDRKAFHRDGESGFNTAMACYVLPRAADLLAASNPEIAADIRAYVERLRGAMQDAWTGRWYRRGWDGSGGPIGEQHLFLDGQVWALIAGLGTLEERERLAEEIRTRLDDPSPIGATVLDRPHPVRHGVLGRGWDCNGGVWAAINGLLAWGYTRVDPQLARRSVEKQSLRAHARAYPHVWYGVWSGPDAYNAAWADRPGETFVHPATPMVEFPVMNTNAHALPLLALLRVLGVETDAGAIRVVPPGGIDTPWHLDTPLLEVRSDGSTIEAKTRPVDGIGGRARIVTSPCDETADARR